MLTDIFAYRYLDHKIWSEYTEVERRLLNQAFGIVKDALPYYTAEGKEHIQNKEKWKLLHSQLARELGVKELAPQFYSYTQKNPIGQEFPVSGFWSYDLVCDTYVNAKYNGGLEVDRFIKERISFIELAMRLCGAEIAKANLTKADTEAQATLSAIFPKPGMRVPGNAAAGIGAWNKHLNDAFAEQVNELNERFRRAKAPLTYHNGFIQLAMDQQIEKQIAKPFWDAVAGAPWENVDIDMKEALDRRDSNDKDPAFFAAKALESAIKIVSSEKNWTSGKETGAAQFIDNLVSKANGGFLAVWEGDMLKDYFRKVRNPIGHGPGDAPMPELSLPQTDWAIETAMSWVRTLVRRM
jgi:hypothetical protein